MTKTTDMVIMKTTDYDKFSDDSRNRGGQPVDMKHVRALAEDFKKRGQLEPILVRSNGKVASGHHRLAAAKLANIPVKYFVDDTAEARDVMEAHRIHKPWTIENFINFQTGGNYKKFRQLANENSLSYNATFVLLTGHTIHGTDRDMMIRGDFVITPSMLLTFKNRIKAIQKLITVREGLFFQTITAVKFVEVLLTLIEHPDYNEKHLISRLNTIHRHELTSINKQSDGAEMLSEVYNKYIKSGVQIDVGYLWKNRNKPVAKAA